LKIERSVPPGTRKRKNGISPWWMWWRCCRTAPIPRIISKKCASGTNSSQATWGQIVPR